MNNILEEMKEKNYRPMTLEEMSKFFNIEEAELIGELNQLVEKGRLIISKKGKYLLPESKGMYLGTLSTYDKGFGFVKLDESREEVFVPNKDLNEAQNGDVVLVSVVPGAKKGKSREGKVERIVKRGLSTFLGTATYFKNKFILVPDDKRVFGKYYIDEKVPGMKAGDKYFVKILEYGSRKRIGLASILTEVSGDDDLEMIIQSIMVKNGIPMEFPQEVETAAASIPQSVEGIEDGDDRWDLTDLHMVTIDGEDAKDFDDAVSLEKMDNGNYELGVHIADVSHYVKLDSIIDKEAYLRGTSTYFPDRVLPMLPFALSNGICSLQADKYRYAISCMMEIDHKGKVQSYDIKPSMIKVNKRMTYTKVAEMLSTGEGENVKWYQDMATLANILTEKRVRRGAILFDIPELKVVVDEDKKVTGLDKRERNQAESIIEEFMLIANETVAEHLFWLDAPCVYRVHEAPPQTGIEGFNEVMKPFGISIPLDGGDVHPKEYQQILDSIKDHPMKEMIMNLLLRSMSHARYDTIPLGHFGLSVVYYCHFTSPIRRYPDLMVHRDLRAYMKGNVSTVTQGKLLSRNQLAAKESSEREIASESAEREVNRVMVVSYMKAFVGDDFEGRVSGMISSGIFVELDNLAEGFVPFATMDGYYTFFEKEMVVRSGSNEVAYRIGDRIKVRLVKGDLPNGRLDFIIEDGENGD